MHTPDVPTHHLLLQATITMDTAGKHVVYIDRYIATPAVMCREA